MMSNDTATHFYAQNTSVPEGSRNVKFFCNDTVGNMNSTTQYFAVDLTPPAITIFEPANATTNDSTPHVNATQSDLYPDSMWYSIDEGGNVYGSWTTEINVNATALSESMHYLTIYANDTAGNVNSATRWFEVDALAPVITIDYPLYEVHGEDMWINISLDQRVSWCGYSLDAAANVTMSNDTLTHYYKFVFGLSKGEYTVTYWCNNTFGIYSSASRDFNITSGFVVVKLTGTGFSPVEDIAGRYVATNLVGGHVAGILHAGGVFKELSSGANYMALSHETLTSGKNAKAYVVYTKGDIGSIDERINFVQSGELEKMANPSFGFGINKRYRVSVGTEYSDIDIIEALKIGRGIQKLKIMHESKNSGKPKINISVYN